jgi:hypothetical protein
MHDARLQRLSGGTSPPKAIRAFRWECPSDEIGFRGSKLEFSSKSSVTNLTMFSLFIWAAVRIMPLVCHAPILMHRSSRSGNT